MIKRNFKTLIDNKHLGFIKFDDPNISLDSILDIVYKDLSAKCTFLSSVYPFNKGLDNYTRMNEIFSMKYHPIMSSPNGETYVDTFEESITAFEKGIFTVDRDFFGSGEWPVIILYLFKEENYIWIYYDISR